MCTVKSSTEAMVCDVAVEHVRELMVARLGAQVRFESVSGEGTRVSCLDPARSAEFRRCLEEALARVSGGG
ncbi:MAG TPA: hypothetical protein VFD49_26415 [Candidatus Dormibacteraeota bacterium]|nr:hypothetical protein [Candidatus Dormibacteraeota bacterium]